MNGTTGYGRDELIELAGTTRMDEAHLSVGGVVGVALPDWVQAAQLLTPHKARQLAAQLLLAADLHDEIINQYEDGKARA